MTRGIADPFLVSQEIGWSLSSGGVRGSSQRAWVESYRRSHRLRGVLSRICRDVGRIKLSVHELPKNGGKSVPIKGNNHPLQRFLRRPWDYGYGGTLADLLGLTQLWLELCGEAFWVVRERDASGRPKDVYPLPPWWVLEPPTNKSAKFVLAAVHPDLPTEVPDWDVIWFRKHNPVNPFSRGSGQAEAVDDEVTLSEVTRKFQVNYFRNSARPDAIIFAKGLNPKQAEELQASWEDRHRGVQNAHRLRVTNVDGHMETIGHNLVDLAITELEHNLRDEIWQLWQVPPEIMGAVENSNRATAEAAQFLYSLNVIDERMSSLVAALNWLLVPEFDPLEKVCLVYASPVVETEQFRLEKTVRLFECGLISRDEGRLAWDYEPVGGDLGASFCQPLNTASIGTPGKPDTQKTPEVDTLCRSIMARLNGTNGLYSKD